MRVPYRKKLGVKVRTVREKLGWSQETLAERTGLHRTYISGIERGARNPTLSVLLKLAAGLRVPAGELIDFSGNS